MSQVTIAKTASHKQKLDFVKSNAANASGQFNKFKATSEMLAIDLDTLLSSLNEQALDNLLNTCKALALETMPQDKILLHHKAWAKEKKLDQGRFKDLVGSWLDANNYDTAKGNFKKFDFAFNVIVSSEFTDEQMQEFIGKLENLFDNLP